MAAHKHKPKFVLGQFPIAAKCDCGQVLIANGGGWVSAAKAEELRKGR